MRGLRSSGFIVLAAFAMLLAQSVFARILAPYPLIPYFGLPLVFALGIARGVPLARGAATSFAIGYLYDVFTGNPMGVHTFVFVVGFVVARLLGVLLGFRGLAFQLGLTFGLTLALGILIEVIRSFTPGGLSWDAAARLWAIVAPALATAVVAPALFALVRRLDPTSERSAA